MQSIGSPTGNFDSLVALQFSNSTMEKEGGEDPTVDQEDNQHDTT